MIGMEELATRIKALDPEEVEVVVRNLPYTAMKEECERRRNEEHGMLIMCREALKLWGKTIDQ